jgi:hypothetical protein
VNESKLSAMFPSTASGASYETTGWMCAAPNVAYSVGLPWASSQTATASDIMSAAQILVNAQKGPLEATKNTNGQYVANNFVTQQIVSDSNDCTAQSTLSTDFASPSLSASGIYEPSSLPLTAAHAMQGAVAGSAGGVAFSAMDSSQADFFGLLPASLQNAAGQFVTPDQASIDAALTDATTNKDGTITPDYDDTGDASAYPLPMVTYALVSTAPQATAAQAQQLTDLLTNLVDYSYAGGVGYSVPMPAGYVPLTTNLYQQALADISKDIVAPAGSTTTATTTTPPTTVATGSGSTVGGSTSVVSGVVKAVTGAVSTVANALGNAATSEPARRVAEVAGGPILLTLDADRFVLPALLALGIACLVGGPLLYLVPSVRRRLATGKHGPRGAEGENGEG